MKAIIIFLSLFATICYGDPETVDGLVPKKRVGLKKEEATPEFYIAKQAPFDRIWKARSSTTRRPTIPLQPTSFEDINEVNSPPKNNLSGSNVNEVVPKPSGLSQKKSDVSFTDEEDSRNGIAALIIGIAFVAAFVGIALSLVAIQSPHFLSQPFFAGRHSEDEGGKAIGKRDSFYEDENQTPPELRGLGSQPSFVQPDVASKDMSSSNEQSPPFFYGKLMLKDSPTDSQEGGGGKASQFVSHTMNSMTSLLIAAQEAISSSSRSPSPTTINNNNNSIRKKSGDLLDLDPSCKKGGSEDVSEEEDDYTVYECRGLASPGEMEVQNPFYLHGEDTFSLEANNNSSTSTGEVPPLTPKPISRVPLLHQGIKGYN